MADERVRILLEARDNASATINKVGTSLDNMKPTVGGLSGSFGKLLPVMGAIGGAFAAVGGASAAMDLAAAGAKAEALGASFDMMAQAAGQSSEEMLAAMQRASGGTIANTDLILAANLIDRLYNPALFLSRIHERIHPGGLLVLTSPYTWLTEHTPREAWIGGFKRDGETVTTLDGLQGLLGKYFRRVGEAVDVPFVIRETRRKFQHSVAELTVWERV